MGPAMITSTMKVIRELLAKWRDPEWWKDHGAAMDSVDCANAMQAVLDDAEALGNELITDEWLKAMGFRQQPPHDRQPTAHWLLWFGHTSEERAFGSFDDAGLELCATQLQRVASYDKDDRYHAWLRSDFSHSRGRFLHIRYITTRADVVTLVEALSGVPWDPSWHRLGEVVPLRLRKKREASA